MDFVRTRSRSLLLTTLVVASIDLSALPKGWEYSWWLVETHNGVQPFTSPAERHSYDAVRGTAIVPVQASRVVSALQAFERYTAWYHNAAEVRVLRLPSTIAAIGFGADGSITHVRETGDTAAAPRRSDACRLTPRADDGANRARLALGALRRLRGPGHGCT
jgi:hypothetical protein